MSILKRFKDIMASNVNAALDKMEDPSKMIDQALRDLDKDLGQVKAETAGIMAEEARAKRALDESQTEIDNLASYAEKAVVAGNDADARLFLQKKAQAVENNKSLLATYEAACENSTRMKQMHEKLSGQIAELSARRDSIKAKVTVAKTQGKINKMTQTLDGSASSIYAFEKMEQKANRMLDEASAMAELNSLGANSALDEAKKRYETVMPSVEDELAALKNKLK